MLHFKLLVEASGVGVYLRSMVGSGLFVDAESSDVAGAGF